LQKIRDASFGLNPGPKFVEIGSLGCNAHLDSDPGNAVADADGLIELIGELCERGGAPSSISPAAIPEPIASARAYGLHIRDRYESERHTPRPEVRQCSTGLT
jgi:hypothetical protein